ncbi:nucleoprotein TPR-like isoform X2 [Xenopus laevis]|uniref:Nucleoprotein TPR-like isoform X2 n=1 Tax=Xenopus laevis TaxID=8355 RepID=A0A8J1MXW6_XENLA|nr:nucleoprotein TPR-like isoform X2 [Xenopus laevis]
MLTLHWKDSSPPLVREWHKAMKDQAAMEKAIMVKKGRLDKNTLIWQYWTVNQNTPPFPSRGKRKWGYEEEEQEDDDEDEDDTGIGEGDDSNEETGSADGNEDYEGDDAEGADCTDPDTETEDGMIAVEDNQRAADSQNIGDSGAGTAESTFPQETREQPSSASDRQGPRPPQSPRRQAHPPRLTILAPPQELGPPPAQQHFFDEEDRTVPSTPTLVVPHRTDGFAEAIHSPQVAGVPRFRFGPPEDMPQASSSHWDLGQLASQGGLGMYETPLFLAHEEESGGRSVPTTPLQVAAPVSVFAENPAADTSDHASQSVPMVTTSTGNVPTSVDSGAADEGDEVFVEAESEGIGAESTLEMDTQQEEPVQPSEADLPSTSQDPPTVLLLTQAVANQSPEEYGSNHSPVAVHLKDQEVCVLFSQTRLLPYI